jgi:hypothetical protein
MNCIIELNLRIGCTEVVCILIGNEMIPWLVSESFVCAQRRSIHNQITINTITFIHWILKIASFALIYNRSLTYMCDKQYVQASPRHVSSSDEQCKWWKSIISDTQHESHSPQSIKSTICCVFMIYHKSLLISFSLFSTYSLLLVFYLRLSLFDDRGYRLLNS